jgi:hypothetical protein
MKSKKDIWEHFYSKKKSAWNHDVSVTWYDGIDRWENTYTNHPEVTVRVGSSRNQLNIRKMQDTSREYHWSYNPNGKVKEDA